jgi:hypothetical protein
MPLWPLFGASNTHEDDPIRAIKAAREIHEIVSSLSPQYEKRIGKPLAMHTGICTGLVVTGERMSLRPFQGYFAYFAVREGAVSGCLRPPTLYPYNCEVFLKYVGKCKPISGDVETVSNMPGVRVKKHKKTQASRWPDR